MLCLLPSLIQKKAIVIIYKLYIMSKYIEAYEVFHTLVQRSLLIAIILWAMPQIRIIYHLLISKYIETETRENRKLKV